MNASWIAASDHCLNKTPLGEIESLGNPYFLQHSLPLPFTTQSVRLPLVYLPLTVQHVCDLGTLCHAIGHQERPTQPLPREAEDFLGVTSILGMCLCSHT